VSLFRSRGSDRKPVRVDTVSPDPVAAELDAMRESALLDLHERRYNALSLIEVALIRRRPELSQAACDLLLDVRNALIDPEPVEPPPLPLRYAVPVNPGRS
jgi:hypothetical protein